MELLYHLVKLRRVPRNEERTYENVLNDLSTQISELWDIQTGSGGSLDIMASIIAPAWDIDVFAMVCQKPSEETSRAKQIS